MLRLFHDYETRTVFSKKLILWALGDPTVASSLVAESILSSFSTSFSKILSLISTRESENVFPLREVIFRIHSSDPQRSSAAVAFLVPGILHRHPLRDDSVVREPCYFVDASSSTSRSSSTLRVVQRRLFGSSRFPPKKSHRVVPQVILPTGQRRVPSRARVPAASAARSLLEHAALALRLLLQGDVLDLRRVTRALRRHPRDLHGCGSRRADLKHRQTYPRYEQLQKNIIQRMQK